MIDVEEFFIVYLQPVSPGNVASDMPVAPTLPFLVVARVGGGDDRVTDRGIVDVHVFHTSRALAAAASAQMHQLILELTGRTVVNITAGAKSIDRVKTLKGPSYLQYEDENLKRYVARYEVSSRLTA